MWNYIYGASTDRGDVRTENQDSYLCAAGEVYGTSAALFVVADGMGGLSFGAWISQFIASRFAAWWQEDFPQMVAAGRDSSEDLEELLDQEIWDINQKLLRFNEENQCRAGSTLTLLLLYGSEFYVKNLGDSRVYRSCGDGQLLQLTQDQSLIAQMVRENRMTEEEAAHSKKRNLLTMCMGMFEVPKSFSAKGFLRPGDRFLLCSDGFYNCMDTGRIERTLEERMLSPQEKADYLRRMIAPGSASDNVTVLVVEVGGDEAYAARM